MMSVTKRVSDDVEEYVQSHRKAHENWMEALDRLLGVYEPPLTEERVEEIVEEKLKEANNW